MTEHAVGAWPARTTLVFLGAAAAAWVVTVDRMRGMDAGPGTDLGGLGWFLGVWAAMMAAMMLPSAVPAAVAVARASRALPTAIFGVGYLAVWTAFGVVAYALFRVVTSLDLGRLAWDQDGPYAAGAVIVLAGMLRADAAEGAAAAPVPHPTRSGRAWRPRGRRGERAVLRRLLPGPDGRSVRTRRDERVLDGRDRRRDLRREGVPRTGPRLTRVVGIGLIVLGLWVGVSPSSVPMLTEPGQSPSMEMEMAS